MYKFITGSIIEVENQLNLIESEYTVLSLFVINNETLYCLIKYIQTEIS